MTMGGKHRRSRRLLAQHVRHVVRQRVAGGAVVVDAAGAGAQESVRGGLRQFGDLDDRDGLDELAGAGGDRRSAAAGAGHPGVGFAFVVRVVQHQQAGVGTLQPRSALSLSGSVSALVLSVIRS